MPRLLVQWQTTTRTDWEAYVDVPDGWEVSDSARRVFDAELRKAEEFGLPTGSNIERSIDLIVDENGGTA